MCVCVCVFENVDVDPTLFNRLDENDACGSAQAAETHPLLELLPLLHGHRVSFCNDRHDVDRVAQALHELHVQLAKAWEDENNVFKKT